MNRNSRLLSRDTLKDKNRRLNRRVKSSLIRNLYPRLLFTISELRLGYRFTFSSIYLLVREYRALFILIERGIRKVNGIN